MAESPSFQDARAELTPETEVDNGPHAPPVAVAAERSRIPRQLFTEINVQHIDRGSRATPTA